MDGVSSPGMQNRRAVTGNRNRGRDDMEIGEVDHRGFADQGVSEGRGRSFSSPPTFSNPPIQVVGQVALDTIMRHKV